MLRDPRRYPEPDKFIPERWLPGPGKEVPLEANKMAFGFGRRCVNNDLLFAFLLDIDYDWVWGTSKNLPWQVLRREFREFHYSGFCLC